MSFISVKGQLLFQSLAVAMSQVKQLEVKAATFIQADYEKAKAEIVEALEHFKAEVARLRGEVDAKIIAHIDEGADPHTALMNASNDVPTKAEQAANAPV